MECNARPLSPQLTETFDKLSKQVCSPSEQVALWQLSMKQPLHSHLAADHGMLAAAMPAPVAKPPGRKLAVEAQAGLSSGLKSVQDVVDEWFTGLHGFPAPPLLCEQTIQRSQRLSKKAIDNLSKRWHLPLRIHALAADRCWPVKKALAVYELVM